MNDGTRRAAGIGLVVLGLAMVVISAVGLLTSGGDDADTAAPVPETAPSETPAPTEEPAVEPTATLEPAPTATPEPTPEPTPEATPTTEPTATPEPVPETLDDFVTAFNGANSAGDTSFAFERLHPVVLEIFGAELCQTWLDNRFAGTTIGVTGEPSPLTTTSFGLPDGSTSEVPDYFTVAVDLTFQGSVTAADASFAYIGPDIYWFTNCEAV